MSHALTKKNFVQYLLSPLGLFGLAILSRLGCFYVSYYNIDELTNMIFGKFIVDGQMTLLDFFGNPYFLTHYLYAGVVALAGMKSLVVLHGVHVLWVGFSTLLFYATALQISGKVNAARASALLYIFSSISFFSKDFHAALAESFSILPSLIATWFFFKGCRTEKKVFFFLSGLFVGFAALFKAPAGIMIIPIVVTLFIYYEKPFRFIFYAPLGLLIGLIFPILLSHSPIQTGWGMYKKLMETQGYINSYDQLSFIYWFSKFIIRTSIICLATFPLWFFSGLALKQSWLHSTSREDKISIFYLFIWFMSSWYVVSLGKRVFFHYFVFLLPSLCLLASLHFSTKKFQMKSLWQVGFKGQRYGLVMFMGLLSFITFFYDGFVKFSDRDKVSIENITAKITSLTFPEDRIYIWGLIPQLYYFSERKPASTVIWADSLAGFSPGSPAMEYMRSTGKDLSIPESLVKDIVRYPRMITSPHKVSHLSLNNIDERELLTIYEILEKIEPPTWQKLFEDFFKNPPKLILDTSPTGIRGFSHFPIDQYELLKKFIMDNYVYEETVDGVVFYKLKG